MNYILGLLMQIRNRIFLRRSELDFLFSAVIRSVDFFLLVQLQITMVPGFVHFPVNGEQGQYDLMDVDRIGVFSTTIAKWIHQKSGIQVSMLR